MGFIVKADFEQSIVLAELDEITGSDDTILDESIDSVEEEVKSYLRQRYDVATAMAEVGSARNNLLIRLCVDITLYEIHSRINPRNIPEFRIQRRDDAIQYLRDVANPRNNIEINLPLVDHGEDKGLDISFGQSTNNNGY